jgi:ElaB/YqjD/DUF883 family membrane-anchored ribosome-binding protein
MFDPLPEDPQAPEFSESEARAPVSPPVQGTAPAWDDEIGATTPSQDQLLLEARARQALREASLHDGANPKGEEEPLSSFAYQGFTVQRGGRSTMAETAERIGTAVGTAEREVRRRLELVRHPARSIEFPTAAELADRGAHMMEEIDADVADVRRKAARKLEDLSEQAEERFQHLRRQARTVFWRSGLRAQEVAEKYPLQTIAAIAGTFFMIGIALRLVRRSHRG